MSIYKKIRNIIHGDKGLDLTPLAVFLYVLALLYGTIVRLRHALYSWGLKRSKQLPCVVISIGNITVGGTGKTPMAIFIAKLLADKGYATAVISRGYKGKAEDSGGIVSDGISLFMGADEAGDEPMLMAAHLQHVPVLVGKHRYEMGRIATEEFNTQVIVLDDAFQHLQLKRDIDLVLLDSMRPLGNTYVLPRGSLREPITGLHRGDGYILTRSDQNNAVSGGCEKGFKNNYLEKLFKEKPVFKTRHLPYYFRVKRDAIYPLDTITRHSLSDDFTFLKRKNVLAFSGLGENKYFKHSIEDLHCIVSEFMDFPDHYHYVKDDLDKIAMKAKQLDVDYIMTTEKDYIRFFKTYRWPVELIVVGVKIVFDDDKGFRDYITEKLEKILN